MVMYGDAHLFSGTARSKLLELRLQRSRAQNLMVINVLLRVSRIKAMVMYALLLVSRIKAMYCCVCYAPRRLLTISTKSNNGKVNTCVSLRNRQGILVLDWEVYKYPVPLQYEQFLKLRGVYVLYHLPFLS